MSQFNTYCGCDFEIIGSYKNSNSKANDKLMEEAQTNYEKARDNWLSLELITRESTGIEEVKLTKIKTEKRVKADRPYRVVYYPKPKEL